MCSDQRGLKNLGVYVVASWQACFCAIKSTQVIKTVCVLRPQVNIQIDQGTDPMRITVAGQPHTVDTAATAVAEIINGGNPFGAGGPASLGGAPSSRSDNIFTQDVPQCDSCSRAH